MAVHAGQSAESGIMLILAKPRQVSLCGRAWEAEAYAASRFLVNCVMEECGYFPQNRRSVLCAHVVMLSSRTQSSIRSLISSTAHLPPAWLLRGNH